MLAERIVYRDSHHLIADIGFKIVGAVQALTNAVDEAIIEADAFNILQVLDFVLYLFIKLIHLAFCAAENKEINLVSRFGGNGVGFFTETLPQSTQSLISPESSRAIRSGTTFQPASSSIRGACLMNIR